MNRVINLDEKIFALNKFCQDSQGKTYTGAQLQEALMGLGFTKTVSGALAQKCFPYEKIGVQRLYEIPKNPIYIGILQGIYKKKNENNKKYKRKYYKKISGKDSVETNDTTISQDQAWETLIKAGKVRQKFNIGKLKAEYPSIYLKCLEYEIIKDE